MSLSELEKTAPYLDDNSETHNGWSRKNLIYSLRVPFQDSYLQLKKLYQQNWANQFTDSTYENWDRLPYSRYIKQYLDMGFDHWGNDGAGLNDRSEGEVVIKGKTLPAIILLSGKEVEIPFIAKIKQIRDDLPDDPIYFLPKSFSSPTSLFIGASIYGAANKQYCLSVPFNIDHPKNIKLRTNYGTGYILD